MTKRFAMVIAGVMLFGVALSAAEPDSKQISHRYESGSIRRVEIELPPATTLLVLTGSLPVISIEGTAQVSFEGSPSRLKREAILEGLDVIGTIESSNRLRIVDSREGQARSGWARRLVTEYDITITVPEWTNVEVHQRDGAVTLNGDFGDVVVGLRAGELSATLPKARVKELTARARAGEVRADFGRVTEEMQGLFPGEATYSNPAGQTTVNLKVTFGEIDVKLAE